jgi:uncharacterized membrane protein
VPSRLRIEADRLGDRLEHGDPLWPAQTAIALAIALNLVLADRLTIGPVWLVPAVEGVLLLMLVVMAPRRASEPYAAARRFALVVIGLVTVTNVVSLSLLVRYLVDGGKTGGHALIVSGVVLWATNVLLFAVWFWELDRGGPVSRFNEPGVLPDFQFPQLENPKLAPANWRPGFGDYLYVSLTNATAFSPTDTMPLTQTAKATMAMQSITALLTVGLVVARAVNILA